MTRGLRTPMASSTPDRTTMPPIASAPVDQGTTIAQDSTLAWSAQQASVHPGPHPHDCPPATLGKAQQFSPFHASRPSLTATAATTKPATGSTHHHPHRLLAT